MMNRTNSLLASIFKTKNHIPATNNYWINTETSSLSLVNTYFEHTYLINLPKHRGRKFKNTIPF